jgi:hypothetical protein
MKAPFLARRTHKWLALIVGIQATFWMISGAYMAVVDIDFIHGDSLVRNLSEPIVDGPAGLYPIAAVIERYPEAVRVELVSRFDRLHYKVISEPSPVLLDAASGEALPPVDRARAVELAKHYYAGSGDLAEVELLTDPGRKPTEIQTRPLPLWQIRFDDVFRTTLYVSPGTGDLVTRRHAYWRIYDFLWMFHIMDFENRMDVNNNLLRVAALLGFVFTLSGMWLVVYALKRRRSRSTPDSKKAGSGRTDDLVPKTP